MPLRRLAIDRDELLRALTARDGGLLGTWLHLRDGALRALREPDDDAFEARLEAEPDDWVKVPLFTREYRLMAEFVELVEDDALAVRLDAALSGPAAFRAWDQVLSSDPAEQARWLAHREAALERWATSWLRAQGLAADWSGDPAPPDVPALLWLLLGDGGERTLELETESAAHTTFVRMARDLCELLREPFPARRVRSGTRFLRGPVALERSGRRVTIRLRGEGDSG